MKHSIRIGLAFALALGSAACTTMEKMGAAIDKINAENKAKSEAEARRNLINTRLQQNLPDTLSGTDVRRVTVAVETLMRGEGYDCHDMLERTGATNDGVRIDCSKRKGTDLGQAVGLNVLGNMLGADRGKIIKEEVDESSIYVRSNWNPDGQSSSGLVGFGIFGKRYKVNQNNEHVEEGAYNLADQAGFAQKVRGLKP